MKNIKFTKEEKEIIMADDKGLLRNARNIKSLRERYAKMAHNTLKKNKSITIRLAEKDLLKVKAKAIEEGVPYQTFITSIIHKHIT